jgi:hypothetical protein
LPYANNGPLLKNSDPSVAGCLPQSTVLSGHGQPLTGRQLQIGGIVGGEAMNAPNHKNGTEDTRNVGLIDQNWQHLQRLPEMCRLGFVQAIASFGN